MQEYRTPTIQLILDRKSVRTFTDQPVSRKTLELLVRAGMAAPSARNRQPWVFVVIDDRKILNELGDRLPYSKMAKLAQAGIVICGDMNKTLSGNAEDKRWVLDCSAATENLLLAAESLGLGACWTGMYPEPERMDTVREVLSLPPHILPLSFTPIGYPDGNIFPKDKYDETKVHWNGWQDPETR